MTSDWEIGQAYLERYLEQERQYALDLVNELIESGEVALLSAGGTVSIGLDRGSYGFRVNPVTGTLSIYYDHGFGTAKRALEAVVGDTLFDLAVDVSLRFGVEIGFITEGGLQIDTDDVRFFVGVDLDVAKDTFLEGFLSNFGLEDVSGAITLSETGN